MEKLKLKYGKMKTKIWKNEKLKYEKLKPKI
jgi:hypothetical protein